MKGTVFYFFDYGVSYGGAVHTLMQQMLLMRKCGYQVYGFVSDYNGTPMEKDYEAMFRDNAVMLDSLTYPICSHTEDIDIVETLRCYDNVKAVIQRYQPTLLHSVQINPAVELVSRELGIPHIMNIYQAREDFFALPYANIFPQYHICDSLCFAEAWQKGLGIRSFCVRVSVNKFRPKEHIEKKDKIRAVCVGQISTRKNQLAVIQGTHQAILQGADVTLDLYGSDRSDYAEQCRKYIAEHHLENRICIRGFCTEILDIYADADILICGSKIESYPNVIAEALANGVVLVTTPVAGVPEVIRDEQNGYLCSGYTAEDLAAGISRAFHDFQTGSADTILQNANATFAKLHAEKSVAAALLQVYDEVIKGGVPQGLPGKNEIEKILAPILKSYEAHREMLGQKRVERKLWYFYHIIPRVDKQLKAGKKIYIWGAAGIGREVLQMCRLLKPEWEIQGFLDKKKSGECMGYEITDPEEVIDRQDTILFLAFTRESDEEMQKLAQAGRKYAEDYFLLAPRRW